MNNVRPFVCTMLSLFIMYFGGGTGTAEEQTTVYYTVDSINAIDYGTYELSDDLYTVSRINGYFPIFLSGWQVANNTEKICSPQDVRIVDGTGDAIVLNEIWSEPIDDNRSSRRRIAFLIYLKDGIEGDIEKMESAVNNLTMQISVEISDAIGESNSSLCSIEFKPQIRQVKTATDIIGYTPELVGAFDYLSLAAEEPNILYYANLITQKTRDSEIVCWKIELDIVARWDVECVLGYQTVSSDSSIVWFNSAEPVAKSSKMTLYLLHANTGEIPTFQSAWKEIQPHILISPEPFLIGNHIGGPYYEIQMTNDMDSNNQAEVKE